MRKEIPEEPARRGSHTSAFRAGNDASIFFSGPVEAKTVKSHLNKLTMINYHLVVFIQHEPGELRGP
jgi:hypothetical protein